MPTTPTNMAKPWDNENVLSNQPSGVPRPIIDESVTRAVTQTMAQDSPLMTQARTQGLQQGNRRGLLNSSMAVGAAQDSAYRAALPIAQQEAQQASARNMQSMDIAARERMMDTDIAARERMQETDIGYQTAERALDRELQERIASWNLASSDQNAAAQMLSNMEGMFADNYRSIMANPNLSASARADQITSMMNLRDAQLDFVQQMYSIDLDWPRAS